MNLHYSPLEEGNKLIAEFMEWNDLDLLLDIWTGEAVQVYVPEMKYHTSWDWLMPVVEKIEKMGYDSRIHGNNSDGGFICDFVDSENNEWGLAITHTTKIEAVWLAVIDFINYYKTQNK